MQTGMHWMLPEDELVRNAKTLHERGGSAIRPEGVVVVHLLRCAKLLYVAGINFRIGRNSSFTGRDNRYIQLFQGFRTKRKC
jgi:hypothetical protein